MTHPADQRRSELVEIVGRAMAVAHKTNPDDNSALCGEPIWKSWIDDATAALDALTAAGVDLQGWREIESAPKDGTLIIGSRFHGYRDERFGAQAIWWQPEFEAWISSCREMTLAPGLTFQDGSNKSLHSPSIWKPSHWLPYPDAHAPPPHPTTPNDQYCSGDFEGEPRNAR